MVSVNVSGAEGVGGGQNWEDIKYFRIISFHLRCFGTLGWM